MPKGPAGTLHQTQAATYRSEQRFRRMLERLPAGAYMCDTGGLITFYNQQAVSLWGRAPKLNDPVDRFCGSFRLFAKDGSPLAHDRCWMALAIKEDRSFNGEEIVIERPDGRRVTALAHANPVHDDGGRLVGGVNVLVDITGRKRKEDALKAADRSKNEFIATLAHELRNPLAPIRNVIDLLHMDGFDLQQLPWAVDVLERQVKQMTRLIDDLLDFARISADKLELQRERIEVSDVLRAAIETSRPLITAAGHELIVAEPPSIPLEADRMRLAQVVANLLNNAAKYTPRGGRIWVSAEQQGDEAVITVRDNGLGIEPAALPRIFDMFAQAQAPALRGSDGLGIGLALARQLIERHDGRIEARSQGPGQGSEFVVRLPAATQATRVATVAPPRVLRILVVDHSRTSGGNLKALLQLLGHRVREARDGDHGRYLAEALHPDVILADLTSPASGSLSMARDLRRQDWAKGALLIGVYDRGAEIDLLPLREAGFDDQLVRPVDPAALIALVGKLPPRPAAPRPGNGHWHHPEQVHVVPLPLATR